MSIKAINISEKLSSFSEHWTPKIVGQLNDSHLKVAKILGELEWHSHDETDELFMVVEGRMHLDFRENTLTLEQGEVAVVPKGTEHRTRAEEECSILLIEPAGTTKTGNLEADAGEWI